MGGVRAVSAPIERSQRLGAAPVFRALWRREQAASTGVGNGFAIPHARIPKIVDPVTAYVRMKAPVDFAAPDRKRVSELFVILVPADGDEEDLLLLALIAEAFSDRDLRARLAAASNVSDVRSALAQWMGERQLSATMASLQVSAYARRSPQGVGRRDDRTGCTASHAALSAPAPRAAWLSPHEALHERDAMRGDLARVDRLPHGATGLAIVAAIAKAAVAQQRTDLDERLRDRLGRDVREAEHLEPGRIDDPAAAVALGQRIERGLRRRVPAGGQRFRDRRRFRLRVRRDGVQDRRLAHPRLADENGALRRVKRGRERRDIAFCR